MIDYWSRVETCENEKDRLEGLTHSILCIMDGCSDGFRDSIDLVVNDICINDKVHMHEEIWRK